MSMNEYFKRTSKDWNILGFLNECNIEPLDRKLDCYTKSLEAIVNREEGDRKERAQLLLNKYKKASVNSLGFLDFLC